jgi:SAM-dependent methyltransferase
MQDVQLVSKYIDLKDKTVLDVGCHGGTFSQTFIDKGCSVTGVDVADVVKPEMKSNLNFTFVNESIDALDIDKKFDVVFARNIFPFSKLPAAEVIQTAGEFVASGGIYFFTYFGSDEVWGKEGKVLTVNRADIDTIVGGLKSEFELKFFAEEKFEGPTMSGGVKFWHIFRVVLKKH